VSAPGRRSRSGPLQTASVGQLLAATIGVLLVLAAGGIGGALMANGSLGDDRVLLLDEVGPALRAELNLEAALVNEETGLRGYILAADRSFLAPYDEGRARERAALAEIAQRVGVVGAPVGQELALVRTRVAQWRLAYVSPELARGPTVAGRSLVSSIRGKRYFDGIRAALSALQRSINGKDTRARAHLNAAASTLHTLLILVAVLVLGSVLTAGLVLRRTVTRPLARLEAAARRVGAERLSEPLPAIDRPREVATLALEIDAMRARIVHELQLVEEGRRQLEAQARELARSNAELEQFAYVASHDLQEPLRKISSFSQALHTRYHGQLDERADQYLDFAVDGAKRMQALINDLLAFSRVGRGGREHQPLALADIVGEAVSTLDSTLRASEGRVVVGQLPEVEGDAALLRSLFQNLIGNALKFRGEQPPLVTIEAQPDERSWAISVSDNGIGIEPEYAERIFLIFQRLHTREAFDGSGIGLALARKIVDYHGGRIWLDTDNAQGARFVFTLPSREKEDDERGADLGAAG
jgi:signal transduction histidine kinase